MITNSSLINATIEAHWQRLQDNQPELELTSTQLKTLKRIIGLSDFCAELIINKPSLISTVLATLKNPDGIIDYEVEISAGLAMADNQSSMEALLRDFRNQYMLQIAVLDLLNLQSTERSLLDISCLADALINGAYDWLYKAFCQQYGTPQGPHGAQPLLILGMGKLGGKELNFSSDIDLIFCYPSSGEVKGRRKPLEHQQFFTKLAQQLIHALDATTQHGRVFRVDMRLRPLGESGPLVTNMSAFEDYYQEQGREWERYAMVKARILNSTGEYAQELQQVLQPFVFRRYIDYSAMDSLRDMKALINQEVRRRKLNNNIKLGSGGIREVEFIAQSFQLIKGGRIPELQASSILLTLNQLNQQGFVDDHDYHTLLDSYLFLRKVENTLQQIADQQTQLLPDCDLDKARLAEVMNAPTYEAFEQLLREHREKINQQFQLLIGETPNTPQSQSLEHVDDMQDIWQLSLPQEEMTDIFQRHMPINTAATFSIQIIDLKKQIIKKRPSPKATDTLNILIPQLLSHVITTDPLAINNSNKVELLNRIIHIVLSILRRTTYLQLLLENQGAQQQLARLCFASPWIAEQIAIHPILLDELLNPAILYRPTPYDEFSSELRQMLLRVEPDDLELQMETLRQFKQIQQLRVACADVTNAMPIMQVSDYLTFLAEAIIDEVVNLAWQQMVARYGEPLGTTSQDKKFAVVAYGKLGGLELGYGSDLDLVFLHCAEPDGTTCGKKPIDTNQFYIKLAQRIMHLFMTKTPSGQLYDVDMRLRPSGNSGLLVCHVKTFEHYQVEQAWTWEHQALVRTRVVYGKPDFTAQINQIRQNILSLKRDQHQLKKAVAQMREKMRAHLNKGTADLLDIKQDFGAIADIEFMVQFWVLANTHVTKSLCMWSDNVRILEQLTAHNIISKETKNQLTTAYLDYRNQSHRLALQQASNHVPKSQFIEHQNNVKRIWQETLN
ncbi:bifunctional [glutamate--ammonia ligase]-adenylyl-L-tyrosine phosphorylase/[glutamate--ammonia-ligase] adenylyltransferase [Aliiglaciecola sp.]|nr:bifunctional [glutamate--ammonia ligase]-adenylyl-L-tyrosine phosphorylase/[glutamate--ammonia-ligase] adenylyltransferase [Aliiglaciecola sp.]